MLFIGEQAVLIEVKKSRIQYLIGDELFSSIPTKILNKISTTANWNRALRYLNQENSNFNHLGFFLIRFEIYLKNNFIICLSKNSFEQKILDQVKFQTEFLKEIFAFRNRNHQSFLTKNFPNNFDLEIINSLNVNLNRCWVNKNFQLKGHKYKVLFQKSTAFNFEKTKYGQVTYFSNFDFGDWDLVDLKNGFFYQEGKYKFNVEVCLRLVTEDQVKKTDFLDSLVEEIQKTKKIPFAEKNWHLFNITNNYQFLVKELNQIFSNQNFEQGLNYLGKLFKELQNSYFSILFSQVETKSIFFKFAQSQAEKNKLAELVNRYGI